MENINHWGSVRQDKHIHYDISKVGTQVKQTEAKIIHTTCSMISQLELIQDHTKDAGLPQPKYVQCIKLY